MYDACPTLKLFRGGPLSSQIGTGRSYLTSLLEVGHAVPRPKLTGLEEVMVAWQEQALSLEVALNAALAPQPEPHRSRWERLFRYRTLP